VTLVGRARIFHVVAADAITGRVIQWISRDEVDWDEVYAEQLPRVLNFFRYRCASLAEAEDLTSITFEKAWRGRDRYRRDKGAFSTWLFTIARNAAVDHYRARPPVVPLDEVATVAASTATPEEEVAQRSDAARLAVLLPTLSDRDRELLALKYGAEMSNRDIASATGLSESNVGTILHRATQALRERW
jgi:RNA polymerase sigma-70 factor, ECF subfamily